MKSSSKQKCLDDDSGTGNLLSTSEHCSEWNKQRSYRVKKAKQNVGSSNISLPRRSKVLKSKSVPNRKQNEDGMKVELNFELDLTLSSSSSDSETNLPESHNIAYTPSPLESTNGTVVDQKHENLDIDDDQLFYSSDAETESEGSSRWVRCRRKKRAGKHNRRKTKARSLSFGKDDSNSKYGSSMSQSYQYSSSSDEDIGSYRSLIDLLLSSSSEEGESFVAEQTDDDDARLTSLNNSCIESVPTPNEVGIRAGLDATGSLQQSDTVKLLGHEQGKAHSSVVQPPFSPGNVQHTSAQNTTTENDSRISVYLEQEQLKHSRQDCVLMPFADTTSKNRLRRNRLYCEMCYCYVCGKKVSECRSWDVHCHATDQGPSKGHWNTLRTINLERNATTPTKDKIRTGEPTGSNIGNKEDCHSFSLCQSSPYLTCHKINSRKYTGSESDQQGVSSVASVIDQILNTCWGSEQPSSANDPGNTKHIEVTAAFEPIVSEENTIFERTQFKENRDPVINQYHYIVSSGKDGLELGIVSDQKRVEQSDLRPPLFPKHASSAERKLLAIGA